jgi:hypothetical protein
MHRSLSSLVERWRGSDGEALTIILSQPTTAYEDRHRHIAPSGKCAIVGNLALVDLQASTAELEVVADRAMMEKNRWAGRPDENAFMWR